MSNTDIVEPATRTNLWKIRVLMVLGSILPFAATVSAAIDFSNITDIIDSVVEMMPSFMDLIIAAAPIMITIAIVGFVVGFLNRILSMLRGGGMH